MEKIIYFSKNLRTYLFANELRQQDLAEKLGLTSQAVGLWIKENRIPDWTKLTMLSNFIGISADELVDKDLTWRILRMSNYTEMVAEADDNVYAENALLARYRKHIQNVQNQLTTMVTDGEKVLGGFK